MPAAAALPVTRSIPMDAFDQKKQAGGNQLKG
jgi:hypothetical protein